MKRLFIALLIGALFVSPTAVKGETILSSSTADLGGEKVSISKYLDEKGVGIRLATAAGAKLAEFGEMGSEDKLFKVDGSAVGLVAKDLTGDGVPEIITAAFYGPAASGLYIFNYDSAKKALVPVKFLNDSDPDLSTDFMVSDIRQDSGDDMVINADGSLTALGKIYPTDGMGEIVDGFYTFKFVDGAFKLSEKKPVPAGK